MTQKKKGRLLTVAELQAMPDGAEVWVWCEEQSEVRMDGPASITRVNTGDGFYWDLSAGSFGGEFTPTPDQIDCIEGYEEGSLHLFHVR